MKNRFFLIFAGIVVLGFVAFLAFAWPYRGFVPLIVPPPALPDTTVTSTPTTTSTTPTNGKNTTGLPLKLPDGFSIALLAKNLVNPRVLAMDPDGNLVASITSEGKVVVFSNGETITLLKGLNKPHGLAFDCDGATETCHMYVAEANAVSVYEYNPQSFEAVNRKKLFDLPTGGEHFTRTLELLSDGRLLVAIGSTCNVCHEQDARRATVQVWDGKELKPYAIGLRNSVFMTHRSDGKVWATEMGRDLLGDDIPPDEINVLEEGKNYGWPNCYGQNIHDDAFDKNTYIRNPCMAPFETPSKIDLQAHSAPLGLAFVPSNSSWPKEYWGNLLVAYHGSWNRTVPTGYKVRRFVLDAAGNVTKEEDFITGWHGASKTAVLGRPAGLVFDASANLYVADDRLGVVYLVTPPTR